MNQIRTLDGLSDSQSEQRTNQNQERFDPVRIQLGNGDNISDRENVRRLRSGEL